MKKTVRIVAAILLLAGLLATAACGPQSPEPAASGITADRAGNPITLPAEIERIISIGPSNTEILAALGFAGSLVAVDTYSDNIPEIDPALAAFDMMSPDIEALLSMSPDVIFVPEISMVGGDNPYTAITDAGVCVIYLPSSTSIEEIYEDIRFIAAVMDAGAKGDEIVADMEREIEKVRAVGDTIAEKKKVYFEISAAPYMYSFGRGTFLNELIELMGAVNILGGLDSWTVVSDEEVLNADPDVILTNVNYLEDSVGEIKSRPGWGGVAAVRNDEVYYIDADASGRPSHNVVTALLEMARAVYPDKYEN